MCSKNVTDCKPRFVRLTLLPLTGVLLFCIFGTRMLYAEVSQNLRKLRPQAKPSSERPKWIARAIPALEMPAKITKVFSNDTSSEFEEAYRTFVSRLRVGWDSNHKVQVYPKISKKAIERAYKSTDQWTQQIQARLKEQVDWHKDWEKFNQLSSEKKLSVTRVGEAWEQYHRLALSKEKQKPMWSHVQSDGPTLVILNYYEDPLNNKNAAFFFRHHNPDWADVLLIVNGDKNLLKLPPWVNVISRKNIGHEYCAMMEILPLLLYGKPLDGNEELLELWRKKYSYFMLLNASVRGPFYPLWLGGEASSWVDVFKSQLTEEVWLVGTSFNCMRSIPSLYHLQSFTLMTHRRGLELIYLDFQQRLLILEANGQSCDVADGFQEPGKQSVVFVYEIGMTQTFLSRNIGVKSIALGWQDVDFRFSKGVNTLCMKQDDQYFPTKYFGIGLIPFEVIFYKTNTAKFERVNMDTLELYSLWFDRRFENLSVR